MRSIRKKLAAVCAAALIGCTAGMLPAHAAYGEGGNGVGIMEYLDRGIYAVKSGNGMFVSWRWNADDADDAEFRLYRDDQLIYTSSADKATCYQDGSGNANSAVLVNVKLSDYQREAPYMGRTELRGFSFLRKLEHQYGS